MNELPDLSRIARREGALSRRLFLACGASLATIPWLGRSEQPIVRPRFTDDPFTLGVASGDPDHESVVLWTRLAPKPLEPGGGMPRGAVEVIWELAEDEGMRRIVRSGTTLATPQLGHSVHVEPEGLKPDRWYWYRFRAGDATSPIGRTRTFPAADAEANRLRFAFASCQNYEQGLFTAYEQMAEDELDLVFFLGDYIYEYAAGRNGKIRTHLGPEIESLEEYRVRYAQYRSDEHLHTMHARCPWFVTWDDHEFDNNYATLVSEEKGIDPATFLKRRIDAYQAYYEIMPLRRQSIPKGPNLQLYRKASFGRLAEFMVLDTRQYRTDQPNGDRHSPLNAAALDPNATLLGARQRGWLQSSLVQSQATWNVLAQQVMMGMVHRPSRDTGDPIYSMDQWPGYAAERMALMRFIEERRVSNPVVLTGDIHSNWANELRVDDRQHDAPTIATEFVATSLSSGGNGLDQPDYVTELQERNPCVRWHNRERGYVRCTVTPASWQTDYMVCDEVERPGGRTTTRRSFTVESGHPRLQDA